MSAEFCRIHAFYDCPVCRGEEVVWVIPIVDGADPMGHGGNVIGVIEIPESFDDDLPTYDIEMYEGPGQQLPPMPVVAPVLAPEPAPQGELLERVKAIFAIENEPEYREAAARGRKVHEDALTLIAEDQSLSYQEAIEEILAGREDV
jgi:hypothetical protein